MPDPRDDALLALAAGGDSARLAALRARVAAGEPAPYAAGCLYLRGRRFLIDARAYVTDPEATHLIDVVATEGHRLELELGRPPRVIEFGVGAATLALSLKLDHPHWWVGGLDVDPAALELARANAAAHGVELPVWESDFLDAWPAALPAPDLIFGDPPWGDADDLYTADRTAVYYQHMPPRSAFSPGPNRCAIHDELVARVAARRWSSWLILNYGVLPPALIAASAARLVDHRVLHPEPHLSIVVGRAVTG